MTTPQPQEMQGYLFTDIADPIPAKEKATRKRRQVKETRTVNDALAQMRTIREELNKLLYTPANRPAINSPADIASLVGDELSILDHEEMHLVILDRRNRVQMLVRLYSGSVNSSQVRIGEVFKDAIKINGSALIVIHNHPSGDPTPSPDDVAVTRAIVQAGKLLDVDVLDHLVIGAGRWVSLKERGLGFS
jgi:DNA repair protein RadC